MRPRPFLKWPGGKRLIAHEIVAAFPRTFRRYYEPFLGGGAVFFLLAPRSSLLADINKDLINTYECVRAAPEEIIARLKRLSIGKEQFYRIRRSNPTTPLLRAVRFLYLNRTAFNGIYRVNQSGQFNVPFGCKPGTVLCDSEAIRSASQILSHTTLQARDFEATLTAAGTDDLIYADPPYTTVHDNNGFRRYNESIFSWSDQVRLAGAVRAAVLRGATAVVSNAHHADLRELYRGFRTASLTRASCIAGESRFRRPVEEHIFLSQDAIR